ncbi:hypothetical protein BLNAU_22998 [Blattamonas nauphoetae]|uniref:Uncharacterized protein n=1 Tax=Blattamonas nauphoetae TaxID=2049346 RepID=A0ABQ9WRI6_9EUKA|nr:hypothetical protein BLNAU_22998 [Blattamonas nauphoetae]
MKVHGSDQFKFGEIYTIQSISPYDSIIQLPTDTGLTFPDAPPRLNSVTCSLSSDGEDPTVVLAGENFPVNKNFSITFQCTSSSSSSNDFNDLSFDQTFFASTTYFSFPASGLIEGATYVVSNWETGLLSKIGAGSFKVPKTGSVKTAVFRFTNVQHTIGVVEVTGSNLPKGATFIAQFVGFTETLAFTFDSDTHGISEQIVFPSSEFQYLSTYIFEKFVKGPTGMRVVADGLSFTTGEPREEGMNMVVQKGGNTNGSECGEAQIPCGTLSVAWKAGIVLYSLYLCAWTLWYSAQNVHFSACQNISWSDFMRHCMSVQHRTSFSDSELQQDFLLFVNFSTPGRMSHKFFISSDQSKAFCLMEPPTTQERNKSLVTFVLFDEFDLPANSLVGIGTDGESTMTGLGNALQSADLNFVSVDSLLQHTRESIHSHIDPYLLISDAIDSLSSQTAGLTSLICGFAPIRCLSLENHFEKRNTSLLLCDIIDQGRPTPLFPDGPSIHYYLNFCTNPAPNQIIPSSSSCATMDDM